LNAHTVDVAIIGAGIVGAALALALSQRGCSVTVVEAATPGGGATAQGMGHLVVLDDNPAELALSRRGVELWRTLMHELPANAQYDTCGTLWLARTEEDMLAVSRKHELYKSLDLDSHIVSDSELRQLEPNLRNDLAGALRVPGDAVVYAPVATHWLLQKAIHLGATVINQAAATGWDASGVNLQNGNSVAARHIVIAAGMGSAALVPGLPLRPRKGHLAITERYPGFVRHQLVELGYLQSAHGNGMESVAFNVQPRPTGQVLIGSTRQFDTESADVDPPVLAHMLERALDYLPGLGTLQILRTWAGFRPTLPDNLPALGALHKTGTKTRNMWLATGHEGLGVTTALSSAEILCHLITGSACEMDPDPFSPVRFGLTA